MSAEIARDVDVVFGRMIPCRLTGLGRADRRVDLGYLILRVGT